MRAPTSVGTVKSNAVPFTGAITPVGIDVSSMGIKKSASMWQMRLSIVAVGLSIPESEKKPWLVRFTIVVLSVVAL